MTDWVDSKSNDNEVLREGPVRFGSIEFGANTGMCRTLEIKKLPTIHIYHKGCKLTSFPCGPKKFPMLQETLQYYMQRRQEEDAFETILDQGSQLMASTTGSIPTISSSDSVHVIEGEQAMEMAGVLNEMIEQEANGLLNSAKATEAKKKKPWWRKILP